MSERLPTVTVGVITHPRRQAAFLKLLTFLHISVQNYPGIVHLCVCNNGGAAHGQRVGDAIRQSALAACVEWRVLDSTRNNIAVGRNLVIDGTATRLLAFIDDDEFPRAEWLSNLVRGWQRLDADLVAGPILPVYPSGTARWIRGVDVHNVRGKSTGDKVGFVATGNVLLDLEAIGECRLDPAYGRTGGSDTQFFLRLADAGIGIRWVADAVVDEDIPADKATAGYTLRRCLSQGANYRRVLAERNALGSPGLFSLRAAAVAVASCVIALPLVLVAHPRAGDWVKRSASNVGKVRGPRRLLYS